MFRKICAIAILSFIPAVCFGHVPELAYKMKARMIGEVRLFWGFDQQTAPFFAQVDQESEWNPGAKSPVGAQGLSQFMPSTRDWIAKIYSKELGEANAFDPNWAIRAMVIYDRFLFTRLQEHFIFEDVFPATLSAYNGGLGWVTRDRKLAEQNGMDPRVWFGNVDKYSDRADWAIKENRGYVKRIWLILKPFWEQMGF